MQVNVFVENPLPTIECTYGRLKYKGIRERDFGGGHTVEYAVYELE